MWMPCIIKNRRKEVRNFMGCSLRSTLITPRRNYCRSCAAAITIPFKKLWILVKNAATYPKWSSYSVIIPKHSFSALWNVYFLQSSFQVLVFQCLLLFENWLLFLLLLLFFFFYSSFDLERFASTLVDDLKLLWCFLFLSFSLSGW